MFRLLFTPVERPGDEAVFGAHYLPAGDNVLELSNLRYVIPIEGLTPLQVLLAARREKNEKSVPETGTYSTLQWFLNSTMHSRPEFTEDLLSTIPIKAHQSDNTTFAL